MASKRFVPVGSRLTCVAALETRAGAMRDLRRQQDEKIRKRSARYFYDDLRQA